MKVKDLMRVCHLINGQHTYVTDVESGEKYVSYGRYDFTAPPEAGKPAEFILDMKVNSFMCGESGIMIFAKGKE